MQCGGDAMMGSGSDPGAAPSASSSSSATTRTTTSPRSPASSTWRTPITDAVAIGYPPGKECLYLQIGWTDEQIWDALAHAKQPQAFHFQRKIKEAFDPNDVGDRMYPTLPEGYEAGS